MTTRKEIFTAAHKIAREIRNDCSDYRTAFRCALIALYEGYTLGDKTEKTMAERLESIGIQAWEKGSMKRYYINDWQLNDVFGLEIKKNPRTRRIDVIRLNGAPFAKGQLDKWIGTKRYYDAVTDEWIVQYEHGKEEMRKELVDALQV